MNTPIHVLIVDDHPVVREGLHRLLAEESDITVVGEAADGEEAIRLAMRVQPDVVVMDLRMPHVDGIVATRQLRERGVPSRVLVFTGCADGAHIRAALEAGAVGYLLKDVRQAELVRAIRVVAAGDVVLHPEVQRYLMAQSVAPRTASATHDLTTREHAVLDGLAQGRSNKQIAAALHLSEGTVKWYVSAILGKLGVQDRTQAALFAVQHGLAQVA
jgi:DNA-binding NarL/FixJ family response regulator